MCGRVPLQSLIIYIKKQTSSDYFLSKSKLEKKKSMCVQSNEVIAAEWFHCPHRSVIHPFAIILVQQLTFEIHAGRLKKSDKK